MKRETATVNIFWPVPAVTAPTFQKLGGEKSAWREPVGIKRAMRRTTWRKFLTVSPVSRHAAS
jgi:hypothetical protein